MKALRNCAITTVAMLSPISIAEVDERINPIHEEISGRYAECTAYFELISHAMSLSSSPHEAARFKELGNNAMFLSLLMASKGRSQELAVQVTNARVDLNKARMKDEADNRNENISILINKYHSSCDDALAKPPAEIVEAVDQALDEAAKP